ncbi:carcinoembryonic antigen-related cell adhesion molecule 1-like isoform X2 [Meriones unguiculatus]|uniref:carcinoembryonic antigen-related cell adhesion molecule 1-like isoform X2 n=1 Tax=Meriones unguiculatus TaxID=10047 RepID=UPI00293EEC26|nr:carcinoembryonic antigen-related cell adhesion molecule 1-like isoform X2 [Meriones unguiculatus]
MEPPSALLSTCVPWQGLLLTASLLAAWSAPAGAEPASAEPAVEPQPRAVLEGGAVVLRARGLPAGLLGFAWFRGEGSLDDDLLLAYDARAGDTRLGRRHSGREALLDDGSLTLRNLTLEQAGLYTLTARSARLGPRSASAHLSVYPRVSKPSVSSTRRAAVEGGDAVELTCGPRSPNTTYAWRLNGRELPGDRAVALSRGNTTLTLLDVSRRFGGRYECEAANPLSASRSDPLTLDILYGPDTPEIFPPDKYFEEGRSLWLSCQAESHPRAHYSWSINRGPWEAKEEVLVPKASLQDSGLYACLATNPATGHRSSKVKAVTVVEELPKPHIQIKNKTVLENHLVDLTCEPERAGVSVWWTFNNQRLTATDRVSFSQSNRRLTIDPITRKDAGIYQCGVSNPLISRTSDPVNLAVLYEPSRGLPMSAPLAAALVAEVLAGLAILAGLAYFAFFKRLDSRSRKGKRRRKRKKEKEERERRETVGRTASAGTTVGKESQPDTSVCEDRVRSREESSSPGLTPPQPPPGTRQRNGATGTHARQGLLSQEEGTGRKEAPPRRARRLGRGVPGGRQAAPRRCAWCDWWLSQGVKETQLKCEGTARTPSWNRQLQAPPQLRSQTSTPVSSMSLGPGVSARAAGTAEAGHPRVDLPLPALGRGPHPCRPREAKPAPSRLPPGTPAPCPLEALGARSPSGAPTVCSGHHGRCVPPPPPRSITDSVPEQRRARAPRTGRTTPKNPSPRPHHFPSGPHTLAKQSRLWRTQIL